MSASLSPLLSWRLSIEYFDVVGGEDEVGGRGVGGEVGSGGEEVNKQTECHSTIIIVTTMPAYYCIVNHTPCYRPRFPAHASVAHLLDWAVVLVQKHCLC